MPEVYEFFAGGGMVRAGLGDAWRCVFANDIDPKKAETYRANWGDGAELHVGDIHGIEVARLPGVADLMWGSFPCQDLSLAGAGAGLAGQRSGAFHGFWRLVDGLIGEGRAPRIVAVENVCGTLTSRGGADFGVICRAFVDSGYRVGALVINADLFVPQSRPRLFVIGVREDADWRMADAGGPEAPFHTPALVRAVAGLPQSLRERMAWWRVAPPSDPVAPLVELIEEVREPALWHSQARTKAILDLMAPSHLEQVRAALAKPQRTVGAVYRRTRPDGRGGRIQRAEVRFDGRAGCLRTPAGGSSRQVLMVVEQQRVRTRLMTPRETARLMGLGDDFVLPRSATDAYHVTGDGVAVPVVRHLARALFEPLLKARLRLKAA
ncbi:DNA cytosine methyltransferase [Brevundimonas balnearis]|uniref:DNA (cytosine-5-)-methyltransferase n=1 Tax=Brevundimonas balnearis TaxID=1572858 RepID=A0ABV6R0F0_9CAUL